ncbi:isocitrate lyase/PEP mutase family protein [Amorphus coralli]|uniref:isocitrate lyase/PEP mutase family protein n=1 Tax=Amorphus coralli TaxID=340680 RepID=UPI00036DF3AC|nr:isocitrate lyase/phosphoenolpyruvate mutase family protein [Amorphus coralli]
METGNEAGQRFRDLHAADGLFVMMNAWDRGSLKMVEAIGFPALATTSAGYAYALGRPDATGSLSRDEVLAHIADMAAATTLPVSADTEAGYGATPDEVAETMRLVVQTGAAGCSIEDATYDPAAPLYPVEEAAARVAAARAAIDATGHPFVLTARAECFLTGSDEPLAESIRRLQAYQEAGADCLYAPGLTTREEIAAVISSVDRPVNVLAGLGPDPLAIADLAALGVRRVSLGSNIAQFAYAMAIDAAREIFEDGTFTYARKTAGLGRINAFFETGALPPRPQTG